MVFVKYVIREMFQKTHVIRDLNENRLVIRDRDPPLPPCVVVEVKYFSTQNVVIHTENCKLELPFCCFIFFLLLKCIVISVATFWNSAKNKKSEI